MLRNRKLQEDTKNVHLRLEFRISQRILKERKVREEGSKGRRQKHFEFIPQDRDP